MLEHTRSRDDGHEALCDTDMESKSEDSGKHSVFTEQGASASHMTAGKVLDGNSSLPERTGQASDAVSADTQVRMKDAHELLSSFGRRLSKVLYQITESN